MVQSYPNYCLMIKTITLYTLLCLWVIGPAVADTYPEVLFENSVLDGNYVYSQVHYEGSSWVENVAGKLPISDSVFFTPGNALSLKYTTARDGNWQVTISFSDVSRYYRPERNDRLTFRLFAASGGAMESLPRLAIIQSDTLSAIDISRYVSEDQHNGWVSVSLPLTSISDLRTGEPIQGVRFSKGNVTADVQQLYIDQIEFLPARPPQVKLVSPAVLSSAKAYDQHVDLTWQLPLTPSIRYIKIYRSDDSKNFVPVAIRPIFVQKYTDFVPQSNKKYYYKITWIDYNYQESPFSGVLEAQTKTASDDELLDFIEAAHLHYFLERTEVNSGMHAVQFGVDNAAISVKETGLSLLAQVAGTSRGFVSRAATRSRLLRILNFLEDVERYQGAFPAFIDGRTHRGIFEIDSVPEADLSATASLMQGLLVAQAYFSKDTNETDSLVERINTLWEGVEWNKFTIAGQENILLDKWSPVAGFKHAEPLGGFNESLVSYVLALASPRHAIPPEAYEQGLGIARKLADTSFRLELANNHAFSVTAIGDSTALLPKYNEFPYRSDTTAYGLPIAVGSINRSLLEAYVPFLAFDPRGKRDTFADYYANHINLIQAYRRRDNELNNGSFSLDIWGLRQPGNEVPENSQTVINPAIAIGSYAYLPQEAIKSVSRFYHMYGKALFTEYGFRKWIDIKANAAADEYDAIDAATVIVMLENGRTGLIWDLFSGLPAINAVVQDHFTSVDR